MERDYKNGKETMPEIILQYGESRYNILMDKQLWNKPTDDEEKIIALQGEIKKLKTTKPNKKQPAPKSGKDKTGKKKGAEGWKTIAPKQGESGKKTLMKLNGTGATPTKSGDGI